MPIMFTMEPDTEVGAIQAWSLKRFCKSPQWNRTLKFGSYKPGLLKDIVKVHHDSCLQLNRTFKFSPLHTSRIS